MNRKSKGDPAGMFFLLISMIGIFFSIENYNPVILFFAILSLIIAIFFIIKQYKREEPILEKIRQEKKELMETRQKRNLIGLGTMTYHGGGLIELSKDIRIAVYEEGLEYDTYFIEKENIESVLLNTQAQMSTHIQQRVTATRMVLFGAFALAAPKSKTTQTEITSKFLGIDYIENGEKYTLLLEGEFATKIQFNLRKMKSI